MTDTNKAASPREELARIIDPEAWYDHDVYARRKTPADDRRAAEKAAPSLARADEWLSRHPVQRGDAHDYR